LGLEPKRGRNGNKKVNGVTTGGAQDGEKIRKCFNGDPSKKGRPKADQLLALLTTGDQKNHKGAGGWEWWGYGLAPRFGGGGKKHAGDRATIKTNKKNLLGRENDEGRGEEATE